MNKIKRHIPAFVDHDEEDLVEIEFETVDELLAIEWVARWATNYAGSRFIQYSKALATKHGTGLLMVELTDELDNKRRWYVIGFLDDDSIDLPICSTVND